MSQLALQVRIAGLRAEWDLVTRGFNPNQPRDKNGRFIKAAGTTAPAPKPTAPTKAATPKAPSNAARIAHDAESKATLRAIFGRDLSPQELSDIVGIHKGGSIRLETYEPGEAVQVTFKGHGVAGDFILLRDGTQIVHGGSTVVNSGERSPASARAILETFTAMRQAGITKMQAIATRAPAFGKFKGMNGYDTWAKLGFTGPIPKRDSAGKPLLKAAQAAFGAQIKTVEQLMQQPGGPRWWKTHGDSWEATFDFTNGSYSRRVFDALYARVQARNP